MSMVHDDTESQINDRRRNVFRFDRSINIGTLLSISAVVASAFFAYKGIVDKLDHIERAAVKSDVMWEHFVKEHNDISLEDLRSVR